MDKDVHIYNEILLSHEKWNFFICSNMNRLRGHYVKWNESNRERPILYNITYMWNLKNKTVSKTKEKQIHRYREQINSYQWGEGREERWYSGMGSKKRLLWDYVKFLKIIMYYRI